MLDGKEYLILDNFLPDSLLSTLYNAASFGKNWTYNPNSSGLEEHVLEKFGPNPKIKLDADQFVYPVYDAQHNVFDQNLWPDVKAVLYFLEHATGYKVVWLDRIKVNFLWKDANNDGKYHPPHLDYPDADALSMVLYLNDSDGDTVLFDKKLKEGTMFDLKEIYRSSPKRGKAIIFHSNRFHSSSNPEINKERFIINFTFKVEKNE